MKPRTLFAALVFAGNAGVVPPLATFAGMPQPMCIFYGQARDGYGLPYLTDADVILRHGTNEIARHTIRGSLSPGVNFALDVHLDDGRSAKNYSPRALHSGDAVSIVVHDREGEKTIMERQAVPSVGQPGDLILQDVTAAEDSDGDGLPDPWERELIAYSDGRLHGLLEVHAADDLDGDGVSNWLEYLSGTFAFLDDDYSFVEQSVVTPNGRLRLSFVSTAGKTYGVQRTTSLTEPDWTPCAFGLDDTNPLELTPVEGNGDWFSVFVGIGEPSGFFRLIVE